MDPVASISLLEFFDSQPSNQLVKTDWTIVPHAGEKKENSIEVTYNVRKESEVNN